MNTKDSRRSLFESIFRPDRRRRQSRCRPADQRRTCRPRPRTAASAGRERRNRRDDILRRQLISPNTKTQAIDELIQQMAEYKADLLIAGPAFESGRYGVACGAICQAAQQQLGIAAVAGMDADNVGADLYRKNIYIINSGVTIARMAPTLQRMAALGIETGAPRGDRQTGRRRLFDARHQAQ